MSGASWLQEVCNPGAGLPALPAPPKGAALRSQAREHPAERGRQVRHQGLSLLLAMSAMHALTVHHLHNRRLLWGMHMQGLHVRCLDRHNAEHAG